MPRPAHLGLALLAAISLSCHDAPPTEPSAAPLLDEKDPTDSPADPPDYPLPRVVVPQWRIAFTSLREHPEEEVYTMNPDGSAQTRITVGTAENTEPSWSPDGTRIVFSRRDYPGPGSARRLHVMNANGTGFTPPLGFGWTPAWSPDIGGFGTLIAFVKGEEPTPFDQQGLWLTLPDGSYSWPVPNTLPGVARYDPTWSPDGWRLAFNVFSTDRLYWANDIFVVNRDGSGLQNLTNGLQEPGVGPQSWSPAWSPDGKLIAYANDRDGDHNLYVMTPDGLSDNRLTNHPAWDFGPAWSPDGSMIAFTSNRDGHYQIYVMNADGSNQHNTSNSPYPDWDPDWGVVMTLPVQIVNQGDIPIDPSLSEGITYAILSMTDFDAVERVDMSSLAFGKTGTEQSLIGCDERGADVNGDRLPDLVCDFDASRTGLRVGDREAVLTGLAATGLVLEGRGVVEVVSGGRETR